MRAQDKHLEGPEFERERVESPESARQREDELPTFADEQVVDTALSPARLFDAIRTLLAGEHLDLATLGFPPREHRALDFLSTAITGRDGLGTFVYAEDRHAMLEQALAVLQQNITHGAPEDLAKLHAKYREMTSQLAQLREDLTSLEDAQDELIVHDVTAEHVESDSDDEPDPDELVTDPAHPIDGFVAAALQALRAIARSREPGPIGPIGPTSEPSSSLLGPELPAGPAVRSTLTGPDRAAANPAESSLSGGAEAQRPDAKSSLSGPERPLPPAPASTLSGPQREVHKPLASLAADRAMEPGPPATAPNRGGPKRA